MRASTHSRPFCLSVPKLIASLLSPDSVSGVRLGDLERRMRDRWQRLVSSLWEDVQAASKQLSLLAEVGLPSGAIFTAGLEEGSWRQSSACRVCRMGYADGALFLGTMTHALVDYKLFWITCKDAMEAYYLLAIINSDALYQGSSPPYVEGPVRSARLAKAPVEAADPGVRRRPTRCTSRCPRPARRRRRVPPSS